MLTENTAAIDADITITESWKGFLQAVNPYLKITGEMCVKNIAKTIMRKINAYVYEENAFTLNDEKIFEYYDEIVSRYSEAVKLCEDNLSEIGDARVSEILGGVCEILTAQLKQYEEHTGRRAGTLGRAFKNPIGAEKERAVAAVYKSVQEALSAVSGGILSEGGYFGENELKAFCLSCREKSVNESHIDLFTFMYQRVIEKGGLDIYKSYSGALTGCAASINSLELRKETGYYYEALKREEETLGSIVQIQISALSGEPQSAGADRERELVSGIARLLGDIYESLREKTEELNGIFGEAETAVKKPALMNYDGFLSFIEERGLCVCADKMSAEGLESGTLCAVELWKERLDAFARDFRRFAEGFIKAEPDQKPYKLFLYEMSKNVTDKLILTEEMLKAFRELTDFYNENIGRLSEGAPDDCLRIIEGINESVAIKADTLFDAKRGFEEEAGRMLSSFKPPEFTGEDEEKLFNSRLFAWGEETLGLDAYGANYAEEAREAVRAATLKLKRINFTDDYAEKIQRNISKETDKLLKLVASYLKNSVLFEIITFEEILAYSVSKLRESENASAAEYAARCQAVEETLIKLCKLHNIAIIAPEPHEFFNSSEHEVLVAEKNEGYKKGQIIKRMNSGFKYNEAVLVRANVIAAR